MDKLFFISSIIISIYFAYLADKKDKKKILLIPILILSIISGFRGITVGVDTKAYYYAFVNGFPNSWQFEETGFRIVSNFLMGIFHNPSILMLIYALITNTLIILRLWDYRKKCNFSVMIFLYAFIYFVETLNIMRQFLAISIIFFSTKLLDKKKYLFFLIIVLLMTFIHQSSLLALLIIVVYLWGKLSLKLKVILFVPLFIIISGVLYLVIGFENHHIINYFSQNNRINNFNITFIYRAFSFVISYLICNGRFVGNRGELKNGNSIKEFKYFSSLYLIGLFFSSMGMFYFVMARFGYFYLIFELLYWGYLIKNKKNKSLYLCLITIFAIYTLGIELVKNGSQIFPYFMSFS